MTKALTITASSVDPGLLGLPWATPLADWSNDHIVFLPKGISRHLVRFANLSGRVVAIKETTTEMARREYDMLGNLARLDAPCVERVAVIERLCVFEVDQKAFSRAGFQHFAPQETVVIAKGAGVASRVPRAVAVQDLGGRQIAHDVMSPIGADPGNPRSSTRPCTLCHGCM